MTNAPNCVSKRSLIARGAAEPPITTRVSESSSRGFAPLLSTYANSISHTVGTPSASVTRSVFINS